MTDSEDVYEVRPRKDRRDCDLISSALPFGRLWWRAQPNAFRHDVPQTQDALRRPFNNIAEQG